MGIAWPVLLAFVLLAVAAAYLWGVRAGSRRSENDLVGVRRRLAHAEEAGAASRRAAARQDGLLASAMAAVDDALIVIDDSEAIVLHNAEAAAWFGLGGGQKASLMSGPGSAELRDAVRSTLAGVSPPGAAVEVRIDGRLFRVRVVPLDDGGAVIFMRDHTEIQRLARARRDLVANVSHDLRTPLTSLMLLAEMLLIDDGQRRAEIVSKIREQVRSLGDLADVLVELSQLDSGRVLLRLEPVRLAGLVERATAAAEAAVQAAGARVLSSVPQGLVVLADAPQIVRVLTNLVDNAARHSPNGGCIRIAAMPAAQEGLQEVSVTDEGPGIPVADADRVFERFYRVDATRSGPGRGLGLAIARHIVEGHGGRIWVDRSHRDGARICFTLPIAPAETRSARDGP